MIRVKNLSKRFLSQGKETIALSDIDIEVEKGDIFGIIGLSGAGKSTLLRCLTTLERPTSGHIFFEGSDIVQMEKQALRNFRKKIGMIFQHFNLLSARTVAGNIAFPLEIEKTPKDTLQKRVEELLDLVGLTSKKEMYPARLSGGEKQRVGIARALANHPDILFCDEPTSSLDPKTTKSILNLLKDLNKRFQITIVLITHEMEVIKQVCNKVAVIDKGRVVEQGLISQVFTDPHHPMTKSLLQNTVHEIPPHFFKESSPYRKLLRLYFKGEKASEPIISKLIKQFNVEANILLGWIDSLQTVMVGNLVIELEGDPKNIQQPLDYLDSQAIHYEVMEKHS